MQSVAVVVYSSESEIEQKLKTARAQYRLMVDAMFDKGMFDSKRLTKEEKLHLHVQGSEIMAAACSNLHWRLIFAYNEMLVSRFDVILDTACVLVPEEVHERIRTCMFRQINCNIGAKSQLNKMLCKGFKRWLLVHKIIMTGVNKHKSSWLYGIPCVEIVFEMYAKNTTTSEKYKVLNLKSHI
jgi:hypothetical protein